MSTTLMPSAVHAVEDGASSHSKGFVFIGAMLMAFGVIALLNILAAQRPSIYFLGFLMIIAGIGQTVHALDVRGWGAGRFALCCGVASGVIYGLGGLFAYSNPQLFATELTPLLTFSLIAAGLFRIWSSGFLRALDGSAWLPLSGAVTLLVGVIFLGAWPEYLTVFLGLLLAADLAFQGVAAASFGLALRHHAG